MVIIKDFSFIVQKTKDARTFLWNYKKTHPCAICGEKDPACLSFHHINGFKKEENVSKLCRKGIRAVKHELSKCQVLCLNCHAKLHYKKDHK